MGGKSRDIANFAITLSFRAPPRANIMSIEFSLHASRREAVPRGRENEFSSLSPPLPATHAFRKCVMLW